MTLTRLSLYINFFLALVTVLLHSAGMFTREQAKRKLKETGWTYRTAAIVLGITYQHLSYVLNGHRHSRRVLAAIERIPEREKAA
jgi:hypothetical protein